jgi:electron transfer flavoprotein beta subunit
MKLSVLASVGMHPISGAPRYCRNDALGLAMGLQLAETQSVQLDVFHAGENDAILGEYLALGAPCVKVIPSTDENTIQNLAENLGNCDLIITGTCTESHANTGLLPYFLAEKLGLPIITNVLEIKPVENALEVLQFLPKGKRRRVLIQLPAVVIVHPLAAIALNYAYARKSTGKIEILAQNGNKLIDKLIVSKQFPIMRKPEKLKASDEKYGIKKTGHQRMMDALEVEGKNGIVVIEQDSVEKAQVILAYLREHHLVDF